MQYKRRRGSKPFAIYIKAKTFMYIAIAVCVIAGTTAFTFKQLYDMRYIRSTITDGESKETTVRIFDTWGKKITYYLDYYDDENKTWRQGWVDKKMVDNN